MSAEKTTLQTEPQKLQVETAIAAGREAEAPLAVGGPMEVGTLEGADRGDLTLSRVHVYQGTTQEETRFGEQRRGALLDRDTGAPLGSPKFIPVAGWREWICWREPRGTGMEFGTQNAADLKPEDLEWGPNGEPPRAQSYIVWACLFEGEDLPHLVYFTKRAYRTGQRLATMAARISGRGLFELGSTQVSNEHGSWHVFTIKPAGPAEEAHYGEAVQWAKTLARLNRGGLAADESGNDTPVNANTPF